MFRYHNGVKVIMFIMSRLLCLGITTVSRCKTLQSTRLDLIHIFIRATTRVKGITTQIIYQY